MRSFSRVSPLILLIVAIVIIQTTLLYFLLLPELQTKKHFVKKSNPCVNRTLVRAQWTSNISNIQCKNTLKIRGAYVFYITPTLPEYECYIKALLHQLQYVYICYDNVHYVILHQPGHALTTEIYKFNNVQLKEVEMPVLIHATSDRYYSQCYLKLELFSLYKEYDRVIFVDADGIFMKDPSPLFHIDLQSRPIGGAYSYWFYPTMWLTSSIFIADLSVDLYKEILEVYKKDLQELFVGRRVLDMEIFNWLFKKNRTKIINDLIYIDSHYIDPSYIKRFYNSSRTPYFVHFSHLKPHLSQRISACLDKTRLKEAKPEFFRVHRSFWEYYYIYC